MLPKRLSGVSVSKLRCTGATSSTPPNSLPSAARARPSKARTIFLSTPLNSWGWWFRRGSLCLRAQSACRRRAAAFCCDGTTKPPWSGCGGVVGVRSCGQVLRLLGALKLSSGWHFDSKHVRGGFNVAADGTSRWGRNFVLRKLHSLRSS